MLLLLVASASATWTVLAIDPDTGEVGAAGATCGPMVWMVAGLAPGEGAVAAQYATRIAGRDEAVERLTAGETPEAIVADLGSAPEDDLLSERQYGVVGFAGPSAGFTGEDVEGDHAELGDDEVRAQGNTLRGTDVVELAYAAATGEGSLAERLLAGLEAGRDAGGDSRCPEDAPARSAFLHVASVDDPRAVSLEAAPLSGDPVAVLRDRFEDGRTGCSTGGSAASGLLAALGMLCAVRRVSPS